MDLGQDQALDLWREALVAGIRGSAPDLTARQMAILLIVYTTPPPHTVRGLARALGIAKPAVSRALDRLGAYGYLTRAPEEADRRSIHVQRTVRGAVYLSEFADLVASAAREAGAAEEKESFDFSPSNS